MSSKALVARKIGMTRMMDEAGQLVPVTLVQIEEQKVTKVLSPEHNGYSAFQVGYYVKRECRLSKADVGRLRKIDVSENFARFKEFRLEKAEAVPQLGALLSTKELEGVTAVDVTGITKGRGFTGSVKRWNVSRGRMTHGSMYHRRPGSLGTRTTPGRVFKLKPVPGHYGTEQVTIQNLKVMDVDHESRVVALCGSVPGFKNGYLFLKPSVKA